MNQQLLEKEETSIHQPRKTATFGFGSLLVLAVAGGAVAYLIHAGITERVHAETALTEQTKQMAVLPVSTLHPKLSAPTEELVLPGNVQAFTDSPIFARTNGYLKKWYVDIGARVKQGQLLAEIETPEVDQQLQQARADLETARANLKLAQSTADRWQNLVKTQSVSQQETEEKVGDLAAKRAMVDSAGSNVRRLEELQSYEKVYAPFDGVITARNTDLGALISAGPGKELYHLAALDRMRAYVSVPEVYRRAAIPGVRARITITEFPGRSFAGVIARNANAIDPASHTLLVEVDLNNEGGELLPGSYIAVHLKLPAKIASAVVIPVNTLLFRSEGLRVATVRSGKAQLIPITIGRDYGSEVEVVSGLSTKDEIIVNPSDSLLSGAEVKVTGGD